MHLYKPIKMLKNSGQVFESEHTDSSDSDIDVSDLINHLDQNLSDPVNRDAKVFPGCWQDPASQGTFNDSVSQNCATA